MEYGVVNYYGAALDEDNEDSLGEVGVRKDVVTAGGNRQRRRIRMVILLLFHTLC